jgi:heme exporter protein C
MHKYFNPGKFGRIINTLLPFTAAACVLLLITGLYYALFNSPPDYQQGETVRIMYLHVPAAWMAMGIYFFIATASAAGLIWRNPLSNIIAYGAAYTGASFTLICLITGALWGKPIWGAWWVWDARLASMLILLFYG